MTMAIYRVQVPDKDGNTMHERLVDAPNQASARGHVARSLFKVEVVKTVDAFKLAKDGVELEQAVAEPAPVEATENIGSLSSEDMNGGAPDPAKGGAGEPPKDDGAPAKGGKAK